MAELAALRAQKKSMNIVLITMDTHLNSAARRAEQELQKTIPGLSLKIHSASEYATSEKLLTECKNDIAEGDIKEETKFLHKFFGNYECTPDINELQIMYYDIEVAIGHSSFSKDTPVTLADGSVVTILDIETMPSKAQRRLEVKDPKTGKMIPAFAADGKGKMMGGGKVMPKKKMMYGGKAKKK